MKIKILKNGTLKKVIGTKYFIVSDYFLFLLIIGKKKYNIRIPKGFITDFGSIPSIFFFFDKSRYISYILHDYLYSLIGKIININGELEYDQSLTDMILYNGLDTEGMSDNGKVLVLLGLGIGGKFHYKKRNKEISNLKKTLFCKKSYG